MRTTIQLSQLLPHFGRHPRMAAFRRLLREGAETVFLEGLQGSAASMFLAAYKQGDRTDGARRPMLVVMNDEDEAGYFFQDLKQLLGAERVCFLPSPYRRAVKYAQRDAGNEIMRTDALSRLSSGEVAAANIVVTFPEAMAVKVVAKTDLQERTITLRQGEEVSPVELEHRLVDLGFRRTDYVYEPGDFALRGSIFDVFSYSCEYPYRIDFFGDEIDSIRTFCVDTQLSEERKNEIDIVPEVEQALTGGRESLFHFLPKETLLVVKNPT